MLREKIHKLVFPEGRVLLKGWSLLAQRIKGLGLHLSKEIKLAKSLVADMKGGGEGEGEGGEKS